MLLKAAYANGFPNTRWNAADAGFISWETAQGVTSTEEGRQFASLNSDTAQTRSKQPLLTLQNTADLHRLAGREKTGEE